MDIATLPVLPHPLPASAQTRLAVFAMRRMGAHGLADARAAHALFTAFGRQFRRPLMLMRAFMADLAAAATGPIQIAPCCCTRMTVAEGVLVAVLGAVADRPDRARLLLRDLLGQPHVDGVWASAAAVVAAFADAGQPLDRG